MAGAMTNLWCMAERREPDSLTRLQVARLLQCSKALVRKYERNGELHPTVDAKGVHRFARAEVLAVGRLRGHRLTTNGEVSGELAAKVFELLRDGLSLPEIVIATRQPPETIRGLWDQYRRLQGGDSAAQSDPFDLSGYDSRARELDREIIERRRRWRR
jgi:hypothetical protein